MWELILTVPLVAIALGLVLRAIAVSSSRWLVIVLGGTLSVFVLAWPTSRYLRHSHQPDQPLNLESVDYVQSQSCQVCHPDHYSTWRRTYHATMTQPATEEAILGDFDGRVRHIDGHEARFLREGDFFYMETRRNGGDSERYRVDRLVGSHEIQVYLTERPDGTFVTLPLEWNERDRRWVSTEGNFLQPPGDVSSQAEWNTNCSYCHNTRVQPRPKQLEHGTFTNSAAQRGGAIGAGFETKMEEMGIACEACHGPGAEHATRNRDPVRRTFYQLSEAVDPSIVNPAKLDSAVSVEVCGRCHGKWFPRSDYQHSMLEEGELYVPAQFPLRAKFEDPLIRAARGQDVEGFLWPDGTPRPTSMEYQGVILSACFSGAELDCGSCHSMHNADPNDQLRFVDIPATPENEGEQMCTQCHSEMEEASSRYEHSKHTTVSCVDCHMPFQSFGLMKGVRSHRVTNPSLGSTAEFGMPNACTQCHVQESLEWAAGVLQVWYGQSIELPRASRFVQAKSSTAAELISGHALTRALAAGSLGRGTVETPESRGWRLSLLFAALEDPYAAVRHQAAESIARLLDEPVVFDYLGDEKLRKSQLDVLREQFGESKLTKVAENDSVNLLLQQRDTRPMVVLE